MAASANPAPYWDKSAPILPSPCPETSSWPPSPHPCTTQHLPSLCWQLGLRMEHQQAGKAFPPGRLTPKVLQMCFMLAASPAKEEARIALSAKYVNESLQIQLHKSNFHSSIAPQCFLICSHIQLQMWKEKSHSSSPL